MLAAAAQLGVVEVITIAELDEEQRRVAIEERFATDGRAQRANELARADRFGHAGDCTRDASDL